MQPSYPSNPPQGYPYPPQSQPQPQQQQQQQQQQVPQGQNPYGQPMPPSGYPSNYPPQPPVPSHNPGVPPPVGSSPPSHNPGGYAPQSSAPFNPGMPQPAPPSGLAYSATPPVPGPSLSYPGVPPVPGAPVGYSATPSVPGPPIGYGGNQPMSGPPSGFVASSPAPAPSQMGYPGAPGSSSLSQPPMNSNPMSPPPMGSTPGLPPASTRRKLYPDQMSQAYGNNSGNTPSMAPSDLTTSNPHIPNSSQFQSNQFGPNPPGSTGPYGAPPMQNPNIQPPGMNMPPSDYSAGSAQPGMAQLSNGMSNMSLGSQTGGSNPNLFPVPPGPSYPGQPPQMSGAPNVGPKGKIDPNNIPSPVDVQTTDQGIYLNEPFRTCSKTVPPLPSTRFRALDEGIASPRFVRMTTYNIPATDELLVQSMLPLGCIVQPLAELEPGEADIELIQPTIAGGPPRCRRCRAYINPMMVFTQGGRKFICNFCQIENEVPAEYFCNLDMNGRRVDIMQRPELRCGSVEYIAGKEFYSQQPQPIAYVIAIDVSWNAVQSGLLAQLSMILRDWLFSESSEQRFPKGAQVAILTYDRAVHFYNFHPSLDQYQMLIVPDFEDMFVPLSTGFLVDPFESRPVIESFLDALPTLFQENRVSDSVLGAVVHSLVTHLKDRGGRLLMFHTSMPATGPGTLKNREDSKLYGTEKENKLFQVADPFYVTLSKDAVAAGVCIDLFLFPYSYMDVATLGNLSMTTGGNSILYPQFQLERDGAKLHTDVLRSLTKQFGYNAMMRVRVSTGLRVVDHIGNFYSKDGIDLEIAGIDADKAIAVALKHDGKLEEKLDSAIQIALLYTTVTGERRIRVHTVSLTNTTVLGNVFRFAELDTTVNFLAKSAMSMALSVGLGVVRGQLTEKCVKVLASYRKNCASTTSPGQLILPETFKLFPLFTLTLHKNKALRAGDMLSDIRIAAMRELRSMSVPMSVPFLYPRMYALHQDDPNRPSFPNQIRISYERLESHGCYLLENGQIAMLWVGRQVPQDVLQGLFGVDTHDQIDTRMHVISPRSHPINDKLQAQVNDLASRYRRHLSITIIRQGMDQLELEFIAHMIEDKNHEAMSYVDFLVYVHRQIHAEIRGKQ